MATQNRGTLGGNIANASPAADSPPALLVYDAQIELVSAAGPRWVPYNGFHTGYKKMLMRPDELIANIRLPRTMRGWRQHYRKVGARKAQAISKICMAAAAQMENGVVRDVRLAFGSVAPTVVRAASAEADVARRTPHARRNRRRARGARARHHPIDDLRSTARYRLRVAQNILEEFLRTLAS